MKQYDSPEQAKIAEEFRREQLRQEQLKQAEKLKAQQKLIMNIPKDTVSPYEQSLLPTVQQKAAAAKKQSANLQNGWRAPIGYKGGELNEATLAALAPGKPKKANTNEQFASDKNINVKAAYSAPDDVTKMTYDDYLSALDNNDQLTANKYNAALRSGMMPYPAISREQREKIVDYNLKQLPSGFKNVLSFAPGLQDSLMPNYRKTFNQGSQSQDAYNYTVDQLIKDAPIGYNTGKIAGNALATTGTAMMLGGAPASASYLGQMGSWAAANGLQSVISDAAQGKNFQDTAKDALVNAAIGGFTGGSLKYLSEMLPQAGTIAYQQLANEYGPTVAGLVAQTAKVLNPGAAEAAKGYRLGNEWAEEYNKIKFLDPKTIRTCQSSVNGLDEIVASMDKEGWLGGPIDVVRMKDGSLTSLNNTRVVAAQETGTKVNAIIHEYSDPLPDEYVNIYTTKKGTPGTWGDAVDLRIKKQNKPYRDAYPNGSYEYDYRKDKSQK